MAFIVSLLCCAVLTLHSCEARPQYQSHGQQVQGHSDEEVEGGELEPQGRSSQQPLHLQQRDIVREPSCEELKAMWRFSKRQARTPEIMNEISTFKDPFAYNEWAPYMSSSDEDVASSRSAGGRGMRVGFRKPPVVYGRVIHKAPITGALGGFANMGPRGYDQVARLYSVIDGSPRRGGGGHVLRLPGGGAGPAPAQSGRFQHLKELIRSERARELQQQRAAEELAARAAAIKQFSNGQRFSTPEQHGHTKHREYLRAPWGAPQDEYNMADDPTHYHTTRGRYSGDSSGTSQTGSVVYPDLLAPPARRTSTPQLLYAPEKDPLSMYLQPFGPLSMQGLLDGQDITRADEPFGLSFN